MKQIILMSIRPEWACKILNGEKTVEVRKSVPHEVLEWLKDTSKPFPEMEVFIYATKAKTLKDRLLRLMSDIKGGFWCLFNQAKYHNYIVDKETNSFDGKVVAKFTLKNVEKLDNEPSYDDSYQKIKKASCLSFGEYYYYATFAKDAIVYALEITQLEIFDKPRELGEYFTSREVRMSMTRGGYQQVSMYDKITHAPQSWQRAWIDE